MGFTKRNKQFEGLDCVLDARKPEYMAAKKISQSQVSYNFQMIFANYTVYFCVATVFLFTMKRLWYFLQGYLYKRGRRKIIGSSLMDVFAAYCRSIGYSQIKLGVANLTFLDMSGGLLIFFVVSWLYLLCICCIPDVWYRECVAFGSPPLALRAGALAIALVPFIFVLSGKRNVISLLTGMGYEKLNVIHRYTAAAAFIFSMIHLIAFIYQNVDDGGSSELRSQFKDHAYYSGIPTFITFAILCLLFTSPLRNYFYELFLHIHWIMAMAFYGTLFWHVFGTPLVSKYLYAIIGLWFSQLIFRSLFLLIKRKGSFVLKPKEFEVTKSGESAILLTIKKTEDWSWKPGQHCFIRLLSNRMLDNHPFSISSFGDGNLQFYIVPKRGLTKELFDKVVENQGSYKGWCLVDGPYGGSLRDFSSFDCLTLIATGSGATATLPFLSAISNVLENSGETEGKQIMSHVNFVWIVRRDSDLSWAMSELRRCQLMAGNFIKITIYISKGSESPEYLLKEKPHAPHLSSKEGLNTAETSCDKIPEKFTQQQSLTSLGYDVTYGDINLLSFKPHVGEVVWDLLPTLERRNMFIACGSPAMMGAVGNTVAKMQSLVFNCTSSKNIEEVYLHTERFGW